MNRKPIERGRGRQGSARAAKSPAPARPRSAARPHALGLTSFPARPWNTKKTIVVPKRAANAAAIGERTEDAREAATDRRYRAPRDGRAKSAAGRSAASDRS